MSWTSLLPFITSPDHHQKDSWRKNYDLPSKMRYSKDSQLWPENYQFLPGIFRMNVWKCVDWWRCWSRQNRRKLWRIKRWHTWICKTTSRKTAEDQRSKISTEIDCRQVEISWINSHITDELASHWSISNKKFRNFLINMIARCTRMHGTLNWSYFRCLK